MHNLLSALLAFFLLPAAPHSVNVEVVSNTTGGTFYVAAYDSAEGFESEDFVSNGATNPDREAPRGNVDLDLPEAGHYVLAAFQDLNGNGELDRNILGVPTEPYGFAKVPPSKWRSPSFEEVATRVEGTDEVRIEVRPWSEY